jgi:hypothetical protein
VPVTLDANGIASLHLDLAAGQFSVGQTLHARFYVNDPAAENGLAVSPAARFTVFGDVPDAIFTGGFE